MSSHFLRKIYNISVYTIGICVLLVATLATTVRILLPDIGTYRSEIEAWVSNYMNLPVVIHTINADWNGWTPVLYLEQIDLLNSAGTEPIIYFDKATIGIDLYASLFRRQIIPEQLVITGLDINVTRLKGGSIDIEGINVGSYQSGDKSDDELGNWFLNQNRIEIQQANINWLDIELDQPTIQLNNVSLVLRSDGNRLQLEGSTRLPSEYGNDMNFSIDVIGDVLSSEWSAEVFLEANDILPGNWYKQYWPEKLTLSGGNASITLWTTLRNTKIYSFHGKLEYNDLGISINDSHVLNITSLTSEFRGVQENDENWLFDIYLEEFISQDNAWPNTDLSLRATNLSEPKNINLELDFNYINLDDLSRFVVLLPNLATNITEYVDNHQISGELLDGVIKYTANAHPEDQFNFNFSFKGVNTEFSRIEPRISGLSGMITGTIEKGQIKFTSDKALVQHFKGNDTLTINGIVDWEVMAEKVSISSDLLSLFNDEINAQLSGQFILSKENSFVDAMLDVSANDIQRFIKYMPYTSRFRTRDWIERSIPTGTLSSLNLLLRGELDKFPYDNNDGQFLANARFINADLTYSQQFPSIENISADMSIHGRKMQIIADSGNIFDSTLSTAKASIPNILIIKKNLSIKGQINGQTKDLKSFIQNSPLNKDLLLSKVNDSLAPSGAMQLDLGLEIPIRNPDQKLSVNGHLSLLDASVYSTISKLELTDINGDIDFTDGSVAVNDMKAKFDGNDVTLSIDGSKNSSENPVTLTLAGVGDQEFIAKQLDAYFPKLTNISPIIKERLSGTTGWEASIAYNQYTGKTELSRLLQVRSNMIGMAIDLPEPLAKKDYESMNLELTKELNSNNGQKTSLTVGDINADFIFSKNAPSNLERVNILFGESELNLPDRPGIYFAGSLENLNASDWVKLIPNKLNLTNKSDKLLVSANILVNKLEYLGQTFNETFIIADNTNKGWHASVNSPDIQGTFTLANLADGDNHIIVDLEVLKIRKNSTESKTITNPALLPSMLVKVHSFKYNEMDLGTLNITAVPTNNGLLIEDLSLNKEQLGIRATGKWNNNRYTGNASSFFIKVHTDEFNQLLDTFGFSHDYIANAETNMTIEANWPGSPTNFALQKLNGTFNFEMNKGSLLNIQPSAGRLFGLLSLQALPRRLELDFSDLFGTGMAFDTISGTFNVKDGNAYTDNLTMKGPSVDIEIRGRTGLADQDYDQMAVITPQISDSIAVASGFLGPVGIVFGTVLYFGSNMIEPLQDSINKIMKVEYSIRGSWNDPLVERTVANKDS